MEGFPLIGLDIALLEKIITKMDGKSYFRLQQTCRTMKDLIRKSDSICVHVNDGIYLEYEESIYQFHTAGCLWKRNMKGKVFNMETLYGTHLRLINMPGGCHGLCRGKTIPECQPLCDALKDNRITCGSFHMEDSKFTTEECVTLLNIANPKKVHVNSCGSKRYEALLQFKTLEEVSVRLNPEDGMIAATKFIHMFPKIEITIAEFMLVGKDKYDVFHELLKILFSNHFPNLRSFKFRISGRQFDLPETFDLMMEFKNYAVRSEWIDQWGIRAHLENVPQSGATCRIEFHDAGRTGSILYYDVKDV